MKTFVPALIFAFLLPGAGFAQVQLLSNPGFESAAADSGLTGFKQYDTTTTSGKTYVSFPVSSYDANNALVSTASGWKTTASDNRIEIWKSGFRGGSSEIAMTASSGNGLLNGGGYFAEINATQTATLYQDVTFSQATVVDYFFLHRGRLSSTTADVMQFVIDYLGEDGVVGGTGSNADTRMVTRIASDTNAAWGAYSGNDVFTAQAGQVYRFAYSAVSSVSPSAGDTSYGNFLDASAFGSGLETLAGFSSGLSPVPEASTYALMGTAVLGGLIIARQRRRLAAAKQV